MIVAAAILQDGVVYAGIPGKERHHDVIRQIVERTGVKPVTGRQGFVDEKGNFMDRVAAGIHAEECGQVTVGKANIHHVFSETYQLFSEDLW